VASDIFIGVIRAWAIARQWASGEMLTGDEATPMAIIGGIVLWTLRLALAPPAGVRNRQPDQRGGQPQPRHNTARSPGTRACHAEWK
jgi:hypothetical protein